MNAVWQTLTLATLPLTQWFRASYLHRLVGPLQSWRRSSWLLQGSDLLGFGLLVLVFGLAPFVSNLLVGLLLTACAGFWFLLTLSDDRTEGTLSTPIHLLVFTYWGISVVATALSPVKAAAVVGLSKLTLYLIFFALIARILRSARLRSALITIWLHVVLIVSCYGIRQWFDQVEPLATWNDPTSSGANVTRVFSYLGNPNLLAGYLLPAIALSVAALFAWRGWLPKTLALTMIIVNCSCLRYTDSRGSFLGFVGLLFVLMILFWFWVADRLPEPWRTWSLPVALGTVAALLILAVVAVEPLRNRVGSIFMGRGDSSSNYRLNVWLSVIDMIKDRPVLGIGPGNTAFNKIYPLFQRPRFSALSAYSIVLEVAVETGFIGLTCFLWLLLVTFNQGITHLSRLRQTRNPDGFWLIGAMAAMAGMLTHGLFDTVWYRPEMSTVWWLMVGLIASYYLRPLEERVE
ncbi:MAG: IctB family putative bicarbonate transporter [Leptolyngbyaceae cyanobacterium bins.59]|nr:IctB family putative bicarbonate transporter [Leptolyngbyaceae cyanobacterium bins.59]